MKKIYHLLEIITCLFLCMSLEGCAPKDYSQYLNKVWIIDNEMEETPVLGFSFRITEMHDGIIVGECCLGEGSILTDCYFEQCSLEGKPGEFSGEIIDGVAECNFQDNHGNEGKLIMKEWEEDSITVSLEYTNKIWEYREAEDETYIFKAYGISDIVDFNVMEEYVREVDMSSFCDAELVCGHLDNREDDVYYPLAYLTTRDGEILYQFDMGAIQGTQISDVMTEDINGDGLEDVRLTICYDLTEAWGSPNTEMTINWNFYQKEKGKFYIAEEDQDYSEYLNRIWFVKTEEKPLITPFAFYFTEIEENNIIGKIDLDGWISMNKSWNENVGVTANIYGKIVNGMAFCDVESDDGSRGKLIVTGWEDDQLIAYLKKKKEDFISDDEGIYLCQAHNIKDLRNIFVVDEYTFETKLDSWGDIWITTVQTNIDEDGNFYSDVYMTTEEGDILNKFNLGTYPDMKVADIVIEDVDGDGLKDVAITTVFKNYEEEIGNIEDERAIKWMNYQNEMGNFVGKEAIDLRNNLPLETGYIWDL